MKLTILLFAALAVTPGTPQLTEPGPLTDTHKRDLTCVAAFAVVASEQERGAEEALQYPLLSERGQTYAGLIGQRVMRETGQSREQVRDAILAAVADQQTQANEAADPSLVVDAAMALCLPLLDTELPPKPKPTLNQCAVMLQLAYETVYAREKLSKTAQDLKTLAFVLDSRAREVMRDEGKSGTESDIILTQIKEDMKQPATGSAGDRELDIDHCFALAAPKPKGPRHD